MADLFSPDYSKSKLQLDASKGVDVNARLSGTESYLLGLFSVLLGALVVGAMVWAGIQYISSQGNPDAVKRAKQTLVNALLAAVVASAAIGIISIILRLARSAANTV